MDILWTMAAVKRGLDLVRSGYALAKDAGLRSSEEKSGAVGTSLGSPQDGREAPPSIKRHREEVADRLKLSLELLNKGHRYNSLTIPEIAAILGLSSVSDLESYFLGEKDAPFPLLDQIANTFGLSPGWLKFDKGALFAYRSHGLHYHRGGLLGLIEELKPQKIFFVRCLDDFGYAHVAFKLTDWKYEGTCDDWHISDHVGATGQAQLYELWQSLNKIKERLGHLPDTVGRDLPEDRYFSLIRGEIYPGTLLEDVDRYRSYWFDDFTDIDYKYPIAEGRYSRYGSGFVQAQRLVRDCRDSRNSRQEEREAPPPH